MKKKWLLVSLGLAVCMAGCGKSNQAAENRTTEKVVEAAATEVESTTEETTEETTLEETTLESTTQESVEETTSEEVPEETMTEPVVEPESTLTMAQSGTATGVSVLFAGDVCLEEDGFVLDYYDQIGGDLSQCVSPYLLNRMAGADLFMLNHEYSMSDRGAKLDKYYTFRANPSRVNILKEMSVDIVSLANNHTYDYGYDAFVDTLNILQENGIREVGAGLNASQAEQVQYYEINGVKIGIVSASRAEKYVITPKATDSNPGVFWMYDDTRLKEVVTEANTQCDFLVAYLHWGTEDSEYFENYQHNIAQELVDCGVDAIIGGHPHIVQGMEFIGDVPVIYSMGDFWFNGSDKYSMMAQLMVYKDGSCSVEIIPCRQRNYTINYIEDKSEQAGFFQYFSNLSPGVNFG